MASSELSKILNNSILASLQIPLVIVLILILPGVFYVFGKGKRDRKYEGTLTFCALSGIAFLIVISFLVAPEIKDVIQENYVCVHGEYFSDPYDGFHFTTDDGETLELDRIVRFGIPIYDYDKFPEGTYEGTVWYGANSGKMLVFIPDEPYPWE